jgi:hypothetical protein
MSCKSRNHRIKTRSTLPQVLRSTSWPFLDLGAHTGGSRLVMVEEKDFIDPRGAFAQFEERIARLEQRLTDDNFKQSFVPKKPERIVAEEKSAPLQPVENP